jgi:hypothetical protein
VAVHLTVSLMGEKEYFDIRRNLGVLSRTELSRMRCTDHPDNIGKQNIYEHNLDGL